MPDYPIHFRGTSSSVAGVQAVWQSAASGNERLFCAVPPEFKGPGGGYSPEDLYLLALMNCFVATFKVVAENSKLLFEKIEGRSTLAVDRDEAGSPWMARVDLAFAVTGASSVDRVGRLLERTSRQCMIINSVKSDVRFEFSVS